MRREVITLFGRVQGVGYRERVLAIARTHAVAGTVRNVSSGQALEIDVEGDDAVVDAFVDAVLTRGPFFARVDAVDRKRHEPRGVTGFVRAPSS